MLTSIVESHIYYIHTEDEVANLAAAIIPLADSIAAVSTPGQRHHMRRMLSCKHFRLKQASGVKSMLLRACKYTKAHLGEYFPLLQNDVLINTQRLEDAVNAYWLNFRKLREQVISVP